MNTSNDVHLGVRLRNGYDGLARIIGDLQRFGADLQSLSWNAIDDTRDEASMTLRISAQAFSQNWVERLSKHPSVVAVVWPMDPAANDFVPNAQSSFSKEWLCHAQA